MIVVYQISNILPISTIFIYRHLGVAVYNII